MQHSVDGLIPARGFQDRCMAPRPEFNDGSSPGPIPVRLNDEEPAVNTDSLRTPPSTYGKKIRYAVLEFENLLDSSSIDSKGWTDIARTVSRNYVLFDGFVILHGTDSLAYTCSALSFMLQQLGKPVILTGSQVPFSERKTDAVENLLDSLDIAGHFMIPEVCLCFNSRLFRGNRTTKVSANAFDAFASPNMEPLAKITAMEIDVKWNLIMRPTTLRPFSIQTNLDTNNVACLRIFPGIQPAMVDAVLRTEGLRGLVLETFGAGNAPSGRDNAMMKVIQAAIQRGGLRQALCTALAGSTDTCGRYRYCQYHPMSGRQRQPHLRARDGARPGWGCCWRRHDDRSSPHQAVIPSGFAGCYARDRHTRHVGVSARRNDRRHEDDIQTPFRLTVELSHESHCYCIRDCRRGLGEGKRALER